jgi:hypothetical protein
MDRGGDGVLHHEGRLGVQNHANRERYDTYFRYGRWHYECASKVGSDFYYLVAAYEWGAGVHYEHPRVPRYHGYNCVPQPKGTGLTKTTTSAVTFSAGFSVIGFTGTVHAGYDTNASIEVDFPYGRGYLCGEDDLPGGSPKVLIAKNW